MDKEVENALKSMADSIKGLSEAMKTNATMQQEFIQNLATGNKTDSIEAFKTKVAQDKATFESNRKTQMGQIKDKISSLRMDKAKLLDESKFSEAAAIEGQIDDLKEQYDDVKVSSFKAPDPPKVAQPEEKVDPAISQFVGSVEWMRSNPFMRDDAYKVDEHLAADPNWASRTVAERLQEVKKIVENKHNYQSQESFEGPEFGDLGGSGRKGEAKSPFETALRAAAGLDQVALSKQDGGGNGSAQKTQTQE